MAIADPKSIEVVDLDVHYQGKLLKNVVYRELRVNRCAVAAIEKRKNGDVYFRFQPVGNFQWAEAKVWLQGLLELAAHAEELENANK